MTKNNTFKVYRATSSSDLSNILLEPGEPLLVTDTNKLLFGDGLTFADSLEPINLSSNEIMSLIVPKTGVYYDYGTPASQTTVTAVYDGWLYVRIRLATGGNAIVLANYTRGYQVRTTSSNSAANRLAAAILPVKKGDSVTLEYETLATTNAAFSFVNISCEGGSST